MNTRLIVRGRSATPETAFLLRAALLLHEHALLPMEFSWKQLGRGDVMIIADFPEDSAERLPALADQVGKFPGIESVMLCSLTASVT